MCTRTPQPVIDKICHLLRTTGMDLTAIGRACGVTISTVRVYSALVEPEFRRIKKPFPDELQAALVADAIAGLRTGTIAKRYGLTWDVTDCVLKRHREQIEAARECNAPAPVAPVDHYERWIADGFDAAVARSMERLRGFVSETGARIVPVSEAA